MSHPLFLLAIVTMVIVLGVAVWSRLAITRREKHGAGVEGIGGDADPMA